MGLKKQKAAADASRITAALTRTLSPFDHPDYETSSPAQFAEIVKELPPAPPPTPVKAAPPPTPPEAPPPTAAPVIVPDDRPRSTLTPEELTERLYQKKKVRYWLVPQGDEVSMRRLQQELQDTERAAFDFETNTADDDAEDAKIVGISFSTKRGTGYYLPIWHDGYEHNWPVGVLFDFEWWFTSPDKLKIAHNAPFEATWLRKEGILLAEPIFDPMIAANLLKSHPKYKDQDGRGILGLKPLVKKLFGHQMPTYEETVGKRRVQVGFWGSANKAKGAKKGDPKYVEVLRTFNEVDPLTPECLEYTCGDSDWALAEYEDMKVDLDAWDIFDLAMEIDNPLVLVLDQIRTNGWACNKSVLIDYLKPIAQREIARLEVEILAEIRRQLHIPTSDELKLQVSVLPIGMAAVDSPQMHEVALRHAQELAETLRADIIAPVGKEPKPFNIGSGAHLGWLLFDMLRLPIIARTKTGKAQLDEEVMHKLEARFTVVKKDPATGAVIIDEKTGKPETEVKLPLFGKILEWRGYSKILSTYLEGYAEWIGPDGRLHPLLDQIFVRTGRFACKKPNTQNAPRVENDKLGVRSAFWAPEFTSIILPGRPVAYRDEPTLLVFCDYSQIELRVFVHYSGEKGMKAAFERGDDVHGFTAKTAWHLECAANAVKDFHKELRSRAKAVIFGLVFGATEKSISQTVGCTEREAKQIIMTLMTAFPGIKAYMDGMIAFAREHGYVDTMFGRRRELPEIRHWNKWIRMNAERSAINTPIQGSASEIIKLAMVRLNRAFIERGYAAMGVKMVMQIHDELIFEVPVSLVQEVVPLIKQTMELPIPNFEVPIVAEAAVGWKWHQKLDLENNSVSFKYDPAKGQTQEGTIQTYGEEFLRRLEMAGVAYKFKEKKAG
jgi:DNA polymerase I-like protein with 3'-5' exonuclease and polymerase domains